MSIPSHMRGVQGFRRTRKQNGYTIVEIMIFLIITSVLLISAMAVFAGQESKNKFTQSIRETDQQILTVINEVGSGHFPGSGGFSCNPGNPRTQLTGTDSEQGTNEGCVFLGKILHFCADTAVSRPCVSYKAHTVAGSRIRTDGTSGPTETLAQARPVLVIPSAPPANNVPDLSVTYPVPYEIPINKVYTQPGGDISGKRYAIGIFYSLTAGGGLDEPGTTQLSLHRINFLNNTSTDSLNDALPTAFGSGGTVVTTKIDTAVICFQHGSRQAAISIGGSGRQLTTDTFIDNVPEECN